jgi:hypothetical protein
MRRGESVSAFLVEIISTSISLVPTREILPSYSTAFASKRVIASPSVMRSTLTTCL